MEKDKQIKVRESNIELLRNISMFMILVIHANFVALPRIGYDELVSNTIPSVTRYFIESLGIVAVNVFVFISGWFGINTNKKRVLSFVYMVLFYLVVVGILFAILGITPLSIKGVLDILQLTPKDWFIKSYFVLMIIAPILNTYTKNADEKTQRYVMIAFFCFEAVYGWAMGGRRFFVNGYGPLHFIGLYVTAQYIHNKLDSETVPKWINRVFTFPRWIDFTIYLVAAALNTSLMVALAKYTGKTSMHDLIYAYSNPLVIIGALCLLLFFSKLKVPYSRTINWLGASSFAVYLFHGETTIRHQFFIPQIQWIYENNSGVACLFLILVFLSFIYVCSVLIDQIRILSWLINYHIISKKL